MDNRLHISSSPHIHGALSTQTIMIDVCLSLLPALIAGTVIFGLRALLVTAVCVAMCVISEYLFCVITKKDPTILDFSCVVTGLLLAFQLPVNVPLWQAAIGAIFGIVVVKCFFGGIGCNIVNPAITARVLMTISFSSMAVSAFPLDSVATATPLVELMEGKTPSFLDLFLGNTGGAIGETCALALILGGAYLVFRKIITVHIPLSFILTVFIFSFLYGDMSLEFALAQILSGGLFLGAIFMATDYVTSPATPWGKIIFGTLAGVFTCLIRFWGVYPEGVSFAILIMNILDPFIDRLTVRKLFGGGKNA